MTMMIHNTSQIKTVATHRCHYRCSTSCPHQSIKDLSLPNTVVSIPSLVRR